MHDTRATRVLEQNLTLHFILHQSEGRFVAEFGKLRTQLNVVNNIWDENSALLGHYAASSGNSLSTFGDNLSVSSWLVDSWLLMIGPIGCP